MKLVRITANLAADPDTISSVYVPAGSGARTHVQLRDMAIPVGITVDEVLAILAAAESDA